MRTAAREDGGDLVISGQKLWITNGATADYILLAVRTAEHRHKGISMVVFPTGVKGYRVGRKLKKVGNAASDTCELFFDECRIPKRYILGERNQGFYYIMEHFQGERLATALMTQRAHGPRARVGRPLRQGAPCVRATGRQLPGLAAQVRRASGRAWRLPAN